jgi:hypothetical protein
MRSQDRGDAMTEREEFEKLAFGMDFSLERSTIKGRDYSFENTENLWRGFQLGRISRQKQDAELCAEYFSVEGIAQLCANAIEETP